LKIVAVSDTHCHPLDRIIGSLEGDLLIHAGDAMNLGPEEEFHPVVRELEKIRSQFKHVIYVPGNHDFFVEQEPELARAALNKIDVHVLVHEPLELDGITFFGSPYVPLPPAWAFSFGAADQTHRWRHVERMDVLITHGPPRAVLDHGYGCNFLRTAVERLQPDLHIFGHMHEHGGESVQWDHTQFVNVAICNREYWPAIRPRVLDYEKSCPG
jgi:Icc-related predicted phosphoesterase